MGTTATKSNPAMIRYLTDEIPIILISLDNDQSGREKTTTLISELPNAIDWPVPERYGKDPGEAWKPSPSCGVRGASSLYVGGEDR